MLAKLRAAIGIGMPGGVDDIAVRALKSAIAAFFAGTGLGLTPLMNVSVVRAALFAAATAAATVVQNAFIKWAGTP